MRWSFRSGRTDFRRGKARRRTHLRVLQVRNRPVRRGPPRCATRIGDDTGSLDLPELGGEFVQRSVSTTGHDTEAHRQLGWNRGAGEPGKECLTLLDVEMQAVAAVLANGTDAAREVTIGMHYRRTHRLNPLVERLHPPFEDDLNRTDSGREQSASGAGQLVGEIPQLGEAADLRERAPDTAPVRQDRSRRLVHIATGNQQRDIIGQLRPVRLDGSRRTPLPHSGGDERSPFGHRRHDKDVVSSVCHLTPPCGRRIPLFQNLPTRARPLRPSSTHPCHTVGG